MKPRPRPKDFEFFYAPTKNAGDQYAWLGPRTADNHTTVIGHVFHIGCP